MSPVVFACGRSNLEAWPELGQRARLLELPCAGRISVPLLLWTVVRGGGALVLGRQQHTCRFDGAEEPAIARVQQASRLLELAGLSRRRAQFVVPQAGPAGAARAVEQFLAQLGELGDPPLPAPPPESLLDQEGLDSTMALLGWLCEQPGLEPAGAAWLKRAGLLAAPADGVSLSAGPLPQIEVAGGELLRPLQPGAAIQAGLAVMEHLGLRPEGVRVGRGLGGWPLEADALGENGGGPLHCLCPEERAGLEQAGAPALGLDDLLRQRGRELARPARREPVACDGTPEQSALLDALGYEPLDVGPDPLPESFALTPGLRVAAERRLARAEAGGAACLLASSPMALARWALVTRQGSWRSSRVSAALGVQLAARSLADQESL
jgi:coenzyme F420-reducing hydrogenase delta subunit